MRPPRLLFLAFCLLFFPIFLTFYSALTSSPHVSTPSSLAGQATGIHSLFSFNLPSSLFPPSAIISLTDENSTFFIARPAAFGPLLPDKGLSGQLWVGSGFGERSTDSGRELGCSDIPGWKEGDTDLPESRDGKPGSSDMDAGITPGKSHADFLPGSTSRDGYPGSLPPNDGTDDHLHHPLPESVVVDTAEKNRDSSPALKSAHADIQSLQESAEISGQVVLLSRGGCGFLEKVKWAQRRGALAVIVGDDTRGGSLVTMYARGDTSNVTIPALFTSYTTAHLLSSLIPPQDREEHISIDGAKTASEPEAEPTPAVSAAATPSSTQQTTSDEVLPASNSGFLHTLLSIFGLGGGEQVGTLEENRRPPTSGNINWVPVNQEMPRKEAETGDKNSKASKSKTSGDGDGFLIGVQDWRDPDLVAPKSSARAVPTGNSVSEAAKQGKDKDTSTPKGGSITPGSGEYRAVEKSSTSEFKSQRIERRSPDGTKSKGWFSRHFLGVRTEGAEGKKQRFTRDVPKKDTKTKEHEGLWVTLTPTSMSTSPFFDTLLVLVVSPLLTLSVVYILLLLRSRIRRRRWRAPKSLVERLPVRTYHTMPTSSSSSSSSLRSPSPGPVSQTSPLLGSKSTERPVSRPRVQNAESSFESRREKPGTSTTWRRKYTGRQVECVVCLEEYIDGESRVMSLPCGHEFHVECITPWLTTRRRTCPICKGDVVRSMSQSHHAETRPEHDAEAHRGATSAPLPITSMGEDEMTDLERRISDTGLERHGSSSPPSWRNFAALSLSALSGDTIWHQGRADNDS
ncbi:PA and RING finger domain protein [Aspergillus mulundensis]|uniref:RING-type domain-containing protein n=1 Tax=Aspergillus mulundensis TaxID=1810919 RepID=A0A3D8REM5_9EURO|nr:hypothetical protein DSM5745_07550 [Aspergillus mulundensis]RDW72378.1 hypothetical protein DSM5745_07550 [Aspergillus mulundensis]